MDSLELASLLQLGKQQLSHKITVESKVTYVKNLSYISHKTYYIYFEQDLATLGALGSLI